MPTATSQTPTHTYLTDTQKAAAIRTALKARGWNRRKVAVSCHGSTICATILDVSVPKAEVESIARAHEHIDRDAATGEILGGGNTFVSVSFSGAALEPVRAAVLARLSNEPGRVVDVGHGVMAHATTGDGCDLSWSWTHPAIEASTPDGYDRAYGKEFSARRIAELIVSLPHVSTADEEQAACMLHLIGEAA